MVTEYEASGLSRGEFCALHGLALGTLDRYRKQRESLRGEAAEANRWVAVEVSASSPAGVVELSQAGAVGRASGLSVVVGAGRRIELECGFDAATLERLVPLLERA